MSRPAPLWRAARALCAAVMLAAGPVLGQDGATPVPATAASTKADEYQLRVGVRSYARPFAYRSETMVDVLTAVTPGPLAAQRYTGYIVRMCDAVLTEMLLDQTGPGSLLFDKVEVVDIDMVMEAMGEDRPASRFALLQPPTDPSKVFEPRIDILCDPATITNARRIGLIISPPIYLTGVSYVSKTDVPPPIRQDKESGCPEIGRDSNDVSFYFGLVGHTSSARSGVQAFLTANEMPQYRDALNGYLRDEDTCKLRGNQEAVLTDFLRERNLTHEGSVLLFPSHKAAAQAFCRGEIVHYIGDREIILHNVSAIPGCSFSNGDRTFTADRYAIFGRLDYDADQERALRVAKFFEILSQKIVSHPSIIDQSFYDTFHPTAPTRTLDIFFRSVRGAP